MTALPAAEAYALWAPHYDATPNPLLALEERMLGPVLARLEGRRVVDVGCGTGRWARHPAVAGREYAGVDASLPMVRRSRSGRVAVADAARLPLRPAIAGLTLCSFAIGYFPHLRCAFQELARITRSGGTVAVSDLHPESDWERTFSAGGAVYRIEHRRYTISRIVEAARGTGLALEAQYEWAFGEPERHLFQAAGREDLFAAAAGVPAVWAALWKRP